MPPEPVDRKEAKRLGEALYASTRACSIRPTNMFALLKRKFCIQASLKDLQNATPTAPPPPPSPPLPRCATCPTYIASKFETNWTGGTGPAKGKICSLSAKQVEGALAWLACAAAAHGAAGPDFTGLMKVAL